MRMINYAYTRTQSYEHAHAHQYIAYRTSDLLALSVTCRIKHVSTAALLLLLYLYVQHIFHVLVVLPEVHFP